MTRKHFKALAAALKATRPIEDANNRLYATEQWQSMCESVANVCAQDNPRFDRATFLKACGITE